MLHGISGPAGRSLHRNCNGNQSVPWRVLHFCRTSFPAGRVWSSKVICTQLLRMRTKPPRSRTGTEAFTLGGSLGDNPMDAKAEGKTVQNRPDWDNLKVDVMLVVVRSKFARDADLRKKLRATRGQQLAEGHAGDRFWGGRRNHLRNISCVCGMNFQKQRPRRRLQIRRMRPKETKVAELSFKTCWMHGWSRVSQKVQPVQPMKHPARIRYLVDPELGRQPPLQPHASSPKTLSPKP